jgi:hypothetical protein
MCAMLLAVGVSKEAVCLKGLTAAGTVLAAERNVKDFCATFSLPYRNDLTSLKKLLLPAGGLTPADLQQQ